MSHFVEVLVEFTIKHNSGVIETLLGLVLLMSLYLAFRSLKPHPIDAGAMAGGTNFADLEKTIQKLLEKTNVGTSTAVNPEVIKELDSLKLKLTERQMEIEKLKSEAGKTTGMDAGEKLKFEDRIRELSNKLSEYEIISEDIADLSKYKEENSQLKKEIEALRAGGASAAAPAPAKSPPEIVRPKAPEPAAEPPSVAAAAPAPASAPTPAAAPAPVAEAAPPAPAKEETPSFVDDDLMAEFAKAVEEQKMAPETAKGVAKTDAPADPEARTEFDLAKMANEASTMTDTGAAAPAVLEAEMNTEKLENEADDLIKSVDGPAINEFEKFVNKTG